MHKFYIGSRNEFNVFGYLCMCRGQVCVSVCFNLIQARVIQEEGLSVEEMDPLDRLHGKCIGHFLDQRLMCQPSEHSATPGHIFLGGIRKQFEQVVESNPVNNVSLGSLPHILPLAFCLDFPSFLLSIIYCDLKQNNPFIFQLLLVTVFVIAMNSKVGKK